MLLPASLHGIETNNTDIVHTGPRLYGIWRQAVSVRRSRRRRATNYTMKDWQLYYTEDMVNWTYLGTPVTTATFPWANQGNRAWAAQCIERNGKFYWYVSITGPGYGETVSVAVADRPEGPYVDAIGGPLCHGLGFIDPTVFIDDDGQAYLFWGNRNLVWTPERR